MQVTSGTVVTISYDICGPDGEIIESSDISGPVTFLVGRGAIIPGLDRRIEGLDVGDEKTFDLAPEEAFGRVEDAPETEIARTEFPAEAKLEVGTDFEAGTADGGKVRLHIRAVEGDVVKVGLLHPLAGQTIGMTVKVIAVRPATRAETEAGRSLAVPPPPPKRG